MRFIAFFFLNYILVAGMTYLFGYFIYEDIGTTSMVLEIGWMVALPGAFVNCILLTLSYLSRSKVLNWLLCIIPVLLFFIFFALVPLNAAITPGVFLLSTLITNITWRLTFKTKKRRIKSRIIKKTVLRRPEE